MNNLTKILTVGLLLGSTAVMAQPTLETTNSMNYECKVVDVKEHYRTEVTYTKYYKHEDYSPLRTEYSDGYEVTYICLGNNFKDYTYRKYKLGDVFDAVFIVIPL